MKLELHSVVRGGFAAKIKSSKEIQCYLLLSLQIIGFLVFTIYPILWAASKAFYYYDQIPANTKFVGIDNFIALFTKDDTYWRAWITTLKFAFYKLPLEIPLALVIAIVLSKKMRGTNLFRSLYYLPHIISVAIIGIIFSNLFDVFGVVNALAMKWGLISEPIDWFGQTGTAMFVLVLGSIWSSFGINVLYFSAALTNVPVELYESAEIDGAGRLVKFFHVTLPMIAPVFQTILLLAINGTLHVGEYVIVMTNGAPGGNTFTVGAYIIRKFLPGFASGDVNIGYACAISLVTSAICGGVALLYMKASKKLSQVY